MPENNPYMKSLRVTVHRDDYARLLKVIEHNYSRHVTMRSILRVAIREYIERHAKS